MVTDKIKGITIQIKLLYFRWEWNVTHLWKSPYTVFRKLTKPRSPSKKLLHCIFYKTTGIKTSQSFLWSTNSFIVFCVDSGVSVSLVVWLYRRSYESDLLSEFVSVRPLLLISSISSKVFQHLTKESICLCSLTGRTDS